MTPRRVTEAIRSCSAAFMLSSEILCHSSGVIELGKRRERGGRYGGRGGREGGDMGEGRERMNLITEIEPIYTHTDNHM